MTNDIDRDYDYLDIAGAAPPAPLADPNCVAFIEDFVRTHQRAPTMAEVWAGGREFGLADSVTVADEDAPMQRPALGKAELAFGLNCNLSQHSPEEANAFMVGVRFAEHAHGVPEVQAAPGATEETLYRRIAVGLDVLEELAHDERFYRSNDWGKQFFDHKNYALAVLCYAAGIDFEMITYDAQSTLDEDDHDDSVLVDGLPAAGVVA